MKKWKMEMLSRNGPAMLKTTIRPCCPREPPCDAGHLYQKLAPNLLAMQ